MSEEAVTAAEVQAPIVTIKEVGSTQERKAFLAAFAKAQGAFQSIVKNRAVKIKALNKNNVWIEFEFRYADLQEIQNKTRPALSANGLSTSSAILPQEGGTWLSYVLSHADGYQRHSEVFIPYNADEKKYGAAVSYYRRYMASAMLDIAADDDLDENGDGNGVDDGSAAPPAPAPRTPARRAPAAKPASLSAPEHGEPPIPPIDEAELASRAATRTAGAAEARERVTNPVEAEVQRQMAGADDQSKGFTPETVSSGETLGEDDGELAEPGERAFLVKRAKSRGGEELMPKVLAELGLQKLNPLTLDGCTRTMWAAIKAKV